MSHQIQVFIGKTDLLLGGIKGLTQAHLITLEQGFSLIPLTHELRLEVRAGRKKRQGHFVEFSHLTLEMEQFGRVLSKSGQVSYVETCFWGGPGEQSAIVWENGQVVFGPLKLPSSGPISAALKVTGVKRSEYQDEFDVLGLGRYRSNEDWIHQPVFGK